MSDALRQEYREKLKSFGADNWMAGKYGKAPPTSAALDDVFERALQAQQDGGPCICEAAGLNLRCPERRSQHVDGERKPDAWKYRVRRINQSPSGITYGEWEPWQVTMLPLADDDWYQYEEVELYAAPSQEAQPREPCDCAVDPTCKRYHAADGREAQPDALRKAAGRALMLLDAYNKMTLPIGVGEEVREVADDLRAALASQVKGETHG